MKQLTPKQEKFGRLVHEHGNKAEAYRAVYNVENMSDASIASAVTQLLANPLMIEFLEELSESAARVASLNVAWVLDQYMKIATADVRELMETRRICCRHCHGIGHAYQWTDGNEWAEAVAAAMDYNDSIDSNSKKDPRKPKEIPSNAGGFGYWRSKPPHNDCPKCHGEGNLDVFFHDVRNLKGPAKLLYAGVKQTANGFEIKTRDQDGALNFLAKYLGIDIKSLQVSGPKGGPIGVANFKAEDLTDDQLAAFIAAEKPNDAHKS